MKCRHLHALAWWTAASVWMRHGRSCTFVGWFCCWMQDKYLRLNAEFDNFRKRSAKERSDAVNKAKGKVIEVIERAACSGSER